MATSFFVTSTCSLPGLLLGVERLKAAERRVLFWDDRLTWSHHAIGLFWDAVVELLKMVQWSSS